MIFFNKKLLKSALAGDRNLAMELRKMPSGTGGATTFYLFTGNLPGLVEKLQLNDRVTGLTYEEYQTLIPRMEEKFGRRLHYTCWGEPLTVFFTA